MHNGRKNKAIAFASSVAILFLLYLPCVGNAIVLDFESLERIPSGISWTEHFGSGVDISGSTLVIGAEWAGSGASGQASIYQKLDDGTWNRTAVLNHQSYRDDWFGQSVATNGSIVAVGAPRTDYSSNKIETGAVHLFAMNSNGDWESIKRIRDFSSDWYDHFGSKLALSNDHLIVGVPETRAAIPFQRPPIVQGRAFIYEPTTDDWSGSIVRSELLPIDSRRANSFGRSVDVSGDYAIVGSPSHTDGRGAAYIFKRQSQNDWQQVAKFTANGDPLSSAFGADVSISGKFAIVGDPLEELGGAAHIFQEDDAGRWNHLTKLSFEDFDTRSNFGGSVAIDENNLLVGSYNDKLVFAYSLQNGSSWRQTHVIDGRVSNFGFRMAMSEGQAIFGTPSSSFALYTNLVVPEPRSSVLILTLLVTLVGIPTRSWQRDLLVKSI